MAHPNAIRDNWINYMEGDIFNFGVFATEGKAWSHPRGGTLPFFQVLSEIYFLASAQHRCNPRGTRKSVPRYYAQSGYPSSQVVPEWCIDGAGLFADYHGVGATKESNIRVDTEMVALTIDVIGEIIIGEDLRVCGALGDR